MLPVMDCPRVRERSVSADLKRAGSGDEIAVKHPVLVNCACVAFDWVLDPKTKTTKKAVYFLNGSIRILSIDSTNIV